MTLPTDTTMTFDYNFHNFPDEATTSSLNGFYMLHQIFYTQEHGRPTFFHFSSNNSFKIEHFSYSSYFLSFSCNFKLEFFFFSFQGVSARDQATP